MSPLFQYLRSELSAAFEAREARALAFVILEDGFGISATDVYAGKVRHFSEEERQRLAFILQRTLAGEPVQYVLGRAEFDGRTFEVNPAVLIPRPETEELVAWVAADAASTAGKIHLLDAGTGSGCIAVSLALRLPGVRTEAWDLSPEALETARRNAGRHGADVDFRLNDILHPEGESLFDIIVSNPPYVCRSERTDMEPQVLLHEPETALFVPDDDPLLFYRALAALARRRLRTGGAVYMELNRHFGHETQDLFRREGFRQTELRRDLFGNERMLKAVKD